MKKIILTSVMCIFIFALVNNNAVVAQVSVPAPSETVTFKQLKDTAVLGKSFYKEIKENLKKGKFGTAAELSDVQEITEIWTVTDIPGRPEAQELVFYLDSNKDEHAFLSKKGSVKDAGANKLAVVHGDSKAADAIFK